jgi:hypothetical protein
MEVGEISNESYTSKEVCKFQKKRIVENKRTISTRYTN